MPHCLQSFSTRWSCMYFGEVRTYEQLHYFYQKYLHNCELRHLCNHVRIMSCHQWIRYKETRDVSLGYNDGMMFHLVWYDVLIRFTVLFQDIMQCAKCHGAYQLCSRALLVVSMTREGGRERGDSAGNRRCLCPFIAMTDTNTQDREEQRISRIY